MSRTEPLRLAFLPTRSSRPWPARLLAVAMVYGVALFATWLVSPWIQGMSFGLFWVAVIYAAWTAGFTAALAVSVLAVLANNVLQSGTFTGTLEITDMVNLGVFAVTALFASALAAREAQTLTQMRANEAQFRTMAEVSPIGIMIVSPTLDSVYMNPRAQEITGLDEQRLTAEAWRDIIHEDDREEAFSKNTAFREQRIEEYSSEARFRREDGITRWVRVIARWMRRDDGAPVAMVLALDDVTRERELEARLQHAQKMEAVGQLAGGIAHDFNNLLTVITGNLEFVRDAIPSAHPAQQDLQLIGSAAERARLLVKQLLAFGRRQLMTTQEIDLGEALRQAERWFGRVLGDEIRCRVRVPPGESLPVQADPTQLDQVLLNLAVNARDAMLTAQHGREGRGGELRFEADRMHLSAEEAMAWAPLQPGAYVRVRVSDTGHGMDAETQSRVFEPFFTTKDVGHGSGLGLAMVEGIIAQSGGAIRVDSTLGLGTTFTILLPLVEHQASVEAEAGITPFSGEHPRQGTVLVVEDERAVRRTTRRALIRAGYEVYEASNGLEALEKWEERTGELTAVVTDIRMPHLSGTELARRLRLRTPDLPIIYVSGYSDELDRLHGAYDVLLEKPFSRDALLDAVQRALAGRGVE